MITGSVASGTRLAKRAARVVSATLVPALVFAACGTAQPSSRPLAPGQLRAAYAGSSPVLVKLHQRRNQLLSGGITAFKSELRMLRGTPVVINVWASWCGPCRAEFPLFQSASARLGRTIAFLGVDTLDSASDARAFLSGFPVPYPSYEDPSGDLARSLVPAQGVPITLYLDRQGRVVYFHQGAYPSEKDLLGDIRRYAGPA